MKTLTELSSLALAPYTEVTNALVVPIVVRWLIRLISMTFARPVAVSTNHSNIRGNNPLREHEHYIYATDVGFSY